jgi:hypothetical protein
MCNHDDEDADHIIFTCPTAAALWSHLGVTAVPEATV